MPKILVADPVAQEGVQILEKVGQVDIKTGLPKDELIKIIGEYDALVVRSETKVTADVIAAGTNLRAIARAGVGVDNIDVEAATNKGITVVNAPTGNTIAAAEHSIALLMAMARHIPQAHGSLVSHKWERSKFVGTEVRGKTLGVIGLGRVGSEVARRGIGLAMRIVAFDPFVTPERAEQLGVEIADLPTVLKEADFLTIHTPLTDKTRQLLGAEELATMKPTARIINCARGGIVDEQALRDAVDAGRLAGAAVDVFTKEPTTENPLFGSDKIVVTPHLGASTEEAQVQVAVDVAEQIVSILGGQPASYAVNMPMVRPETLAALKPYMPLGVALGDLAAQLAPGALSDVTITYAGEIAQHETALLRASIVQGLLKRVSESQINLVNAATIARQRNLKLVEQTTDDAEDYSSLLRLTVGSGKDSITVGGSVLRGEPHIVQVGDYDDVDFRPEGHLLFCHNTDRPGVIGALGTLLGGRNTNISFMQVGRDAPRGRALMIIGIDEDLNADQVNEIAAMPGIDDARLVSL